MGAKEARRAPVNRLFIERVSESVHVPAVEGAHDGISPDAILVRFRTRRSTGVEFRTHFLDRQNANSRRKQRVGSSQDRIRIDLTHGFDTRNLAMSVDARVGSSRTGDQDIVIEEFSECLLKLSLNGWKLRLDLPSVEFGAVIGKCKLEVPHSIRL